MSDLVGNPDCWFSHAKDQILLRDVCIDIIEPPRGKTNNVVSEQV